MIRQQQHRNGALDVGDDGMTTATPSTTIGVRSDAPSIAAKRNQEDLRVPCIFMHFQYNQPSATTLGVRFFFLGMFFSRGFEFISWCDTSQKTFSYVTLLGRTNKWMYFVPHCVFSFEPVPSFFSDNSRKSGRKHKKSKNTKNAYTFHSYLPWPLL